MRPIRIADTVFHAVATWGTPLADPDGAPDVFLAAGGSFDVPGGAVFTVSFALLRPRSRGTLTFRTGDPSAPPLIRPRHLVEAEDRRRMIEALQEARRIAGPAALARLARGPLQWPASDRVQAAVVTFHHPVGTCRIGADPRNGAVVDPTCRVHGVAGLWIADASVMPDIPSAPTHLTTIMIAERVAERLHATSTTRLGHTAIRT